MKAPHRTMPIKQWVEKDRQRVRVDAWDRITLADIRRSIDAVLQDPEYEPGISVLVDPSRLARPFTTRQTRGVAAHLGRAGPAVAKARWAVVACSPASFGMTRMLEALVEAVPITVMGFETLEEAERWLAGPEPPLPPTEALRGLGT